MLICHFPKIRILDATGNLPIPIFAVLRELIFSTYIKVLGVLQPKPPKRDFSYAPSSIFNPKWHGGQTVGNSSVTGLLPFQPCQLSTCWPFTDIGPSRSAGSFTHLFQNEWNHEAFYSLVRKEAGSSRERLHIDWDSHQRENIPFLLSRHF